MEIVVKDTKWTPQGNVLRIRCDCGEHFPMDADKWYEKCPYCGRWADMKKMRRCE